MVIVRVTDGLGNQMFQYALYRNLQMMGKEAYLDMNNLSKMDESNAPDITLLPNVILKRASSKDVRKLGTDRDNIFSKLRLKILGRRATHILEDYNLHFQEEILEKNNAYLEGYWQSEQYFSNIRDQLLNEFMFPKIMSSKNETVSKKMQGEQSVSLHIRRGDYLKGRAKQLYGGICTEKYYNDAILYMRNKYPNVQFYIFTNDIEWVKQKYCDTDMTIVDWNQGMDDYWDIYLMTQCKHNIIANSSFSWWGAWLNNHSDKEVISPKTWFNPEFHDAKHIICKEWTCIEG